jgi:hypothetical protein
MAQNQNQAPHLTQDSARRAGQDFPGTAKFELAFKRRMVVGVT